MANKLTLGKSLSEDIISAFTHTASEKLTELIKLNSTIDIRDIGYDIIWVSVDEKVSDLVWYTINNTMTWKIMVNKYFY
jgi:hypothetical protein